MDDFEIIWTPKENLMEMILFSDMATVGDSPQSVFDNLMDKIGGAGGADRLWVHRDLQDSHGCVCGSPQQEGHLARVYTARDS